jgi:Collagen triple helix repeat (20 copies)/Chaperone of endosialidase/Head domain of trimeric autotransporter adhesin
MKKITTLLSLCLVLSLTIKAQAPQGFNYQAVARSSTGIALTNQPIGLQLSLHQGSSSGPVIYSETHTVTSNNIGLINVVVGTGTVLSGVFNTIVWSAGPYFIEVGMDVGGGTSYVTMGTQQLMSVPYALYAESSGTGGAVGATGATGQNGLTGDIGATGATGNNGLTGATGLNGLAGATGNTGSTGSTGNIGATGNNGATGVTGATGVAGATGANGTNGTNGTNGIAGIVGATGATGIDGATGQDGNNGTNGATGATGATGLPGNNGLNGNNGAAGATGTTGATGTNGIDGTNGVAGATGAVGATGATGVFSVAGTLGQTLYNNGTSWVATSSFYNNATNVGIGTITPEFKLSLDVDGGIIAKGSFASGSPLLTSGSGTRMIFYPKKAAFRSGYVSATQWDDVNIGNYSTAFGNSTKASGIGSTAAGFNTTASGDYSTALGNGANAFQNSSVSIGTNTTASGVSSTAFGNTTLASGPSSTSLGGFTSATASYSTAMGYTTIASGNYSTAMGYTTTASGVNSTAIGSNVSSNSHQGALMLGDFSTATLMTAATDDIMMARFNGGYKLYSNSALTAGVQLASGGGAWAAVSDRNKKENFIDIDNEDILQKISSLKITNWNYKAQPKATRHVGCMAQDFYLAFHLDGTSDTTINTLDIDGINMAAIQALKKRTDDLNDAMKKLQNQTNENAALKKDISELKSENALLKAEMDGIRIKLDLMDAKSKK